MTKSSDADVRQLIDALSAESPTRRDAAIARLRIIGPRAIARLVAAYDGATDPTIRIAILHALEPAADDRVLPLAARAIRAGGDVAVAAAGMLRELMHRGTSASHAAALDLLLSLASDPSADRRARAAAAGALETAGNDFRGIIGQWFQDSATDEDALWEDAIEGRLTDDPAALRQALSGRVERAPLAVLRRLVEHIREKEQQGRPETSQAWRAVRGALHQALALRGSRIALYDLRETLAGSAAPLPQSFLAAMQAGGDESCLEPIAAAFARAAEHDERWRHQLAQTFHAVVKRERLTTRHAAVRRALAKAPSLARQ